MSQAEKYAEWIVKNADKRGTPEFDTVVAAYNAVKTSQPNLEAKRAADLEAARKEFDPTSGMSGFDKFAAGMGKAMYDVGRGIGQFTGAVSREDVAESRKRDQALMSTGAGMAGNLTGNVAMFAPTAMLPGANTITGAATIGALSGLVQPSTSTGETLMNTAIGGLASAAVPLAITGGKTLKSFVDPLYQKGREKIVGRAIADAAATDPKQLAQALRGTKSAVPGVEYTVAEAAQNPSLAALQRTASQISPVVMNDSVQRQAANNEARALALKGLAPDRQAAEAARKSATTALYQQADQLPVNSQPLQGLLSRPSMQEAMRRAEKLATEAGESFDPQNLTGRGAHYIKMAMDDIASGGPATGIGANETRAVKNTLNDYLTQLETQLPSYGQARTTYAQLSRPINQSDVINEISKRATNFRGDLTPAAYARALRDETAQSVTGNPKATLSSVMEPSQLSSMNAIKDDLLRADFAQTAGRGAGSDTVQKLAYSNILSEAGVPTMIRNFGPAGIVGNVAQRAGQVVYKDANEKMAERLAQALLNPNDAAALIEAGIVTPQMQSIVNGLRRIGTSAGAMTPALAQANQ